MSPSVIAEGPSPGSPRALRHGMYGASASKKTSAIRV
jgi:hypothetical protein